MSAPRSRRTVAAAGQRLRVFYHAGAEDADRSVALLLIHGAGGSLFTLAAASTAVARGQRGCARPAWAR